MTILEEVQLLDSLIDTSRKTGFSMEEIIKGVRTLCVERELGIEEAIEELHWVIKMVKTN